MRTLAAPVPALILALGLAACAAGGGAELPPALEGGTGTLTIENATEGVFFRVRFAPEDSAEPGPDRLNPSEVIRSGARRSWPVTGGRYRVWAQLDGGRAVGGDAICVVPAGGEGLARLGDLAQPGGELEVHNQTSFAIARVFFSLTSQASWGENRLGPTELIVAGGRRTWAVPPGRYNVRIVYQDDVGLSSREATEVRAGARATYVVR